MSNHEINNLDPNDIGLKQVMGSQFQDGTEQPVKAESKKASTYTTHAIPSGRAKPNKVWSPFNAEPCFTQKLMNCAKWASLFAGLYILFYYWQCTGQMQPSAAVPAMTASAVMVGWSFGKYAFRGNR